MPKLHQIIIAFSFACVALLFTVLLFKYLWKGKSSVRSGLLNTLACLFTLVFAFFILEFYFYNFPQSDQFGLTWAAQRWQQKYWKPINAVGFRDVEHSLSDLNHKKIVVVLGDSFAAGYGIKRVEDRFSDRLQKKLGDQWIVLNVAKNGWGTQEEFDALSSLKVRPDVIILTYYINDILSAAFKHGYNDPFRFKRPSGFVVPFIKYSYFINYYYWKIFRFKNIYQLRSNVKKFLDFCFHDQKIWETHKRELTAIVNYAKNNRGRLVFIGFPNLADIQGTRLHLEKVTRLFEMHDIPTLDLALEFSGRKVSDLIVNHLDAHPGVEVHREIAELVFQRFFATLEAP